MNYVIVFLIAFILGYLFCLIGSLETMRKGKLFYMRDDGSWFPYDPEIENQIIKNREQR